MKLTRRLRHAKLERWLLPKIQKAIGSRTHGLGKLDDPCHFLHAALAVPYDRSRIRTFSRSSS